MGVELAALLDALVDRGQHFASNLHFRENVILDSGFLGIRLQRTVNYDFLFQFRCAEQIHILVVR